MGWMIGTKRWIRADELVAVMIDAPFNGWKESIMSDTQAMVKRARQVLGDWLNDVVKRSLVSSGYLF